MRATRRADVEPIEQRVVDAALALAAEDGWEQVRLSTIADRIRTAAGRDRPPLSRRRRHRQRLVRACTPGHAGTTRSRACRATGGRADRAGLHRLARQPGPASPGRGRDPPPQALSLASAPLGAADLRPVPVGARSVGRGAGARFRPAAAGPGDRPDRDHARHLGVLGSGTTALPRSTASEASGGAWPAPAGSRGGCGRRRTLAGPTTPEEPARGKRTANLRAPPATSRRGSGVTCETSKAGRARDDRSSA